MIGFFNPKKTKQQSRKKLFIWIGLKREKDEIKLRVQTNNTCWKLQRFNLFKENTLP